jgi:RNA polymerase sigma factor (sigma-70 family)
MATSEEITRWANEAAAGNKESEEKFVEATLGKLRSVVSKHWSRDRNGQGGITDVVNSTYKQFLVCCRGKASEIRNGEALLFETARLRIIQRIRALKTKMRDPQREIRGDATIENLVGAVPEPVAEIVHQEDLRRLQVLLEELPPEDQALLMSREFLDEPWDQIAEEAGVSVRTVQRRYANLLEELKTKLGGND